MQQPPLPKNIQEQIEKYMRDNNDRRPSVRKAMEFSASLAIQETKWIPVTERLPEVGEHNLVLVYKGNGLVDIAFLKLVTTKGKPWWFNYNWFQESQSITHWQTLPSPPSE